MGNLLNDRAQKNSPQEFGGGALSVKNIPIEETWSHLNEVIVVVVVVVVVVAEEAAAADDAAGNAADDAAK